VAIGPQQHGAILADAVVPRPHAFDIEQVGAAAWRADAVVLCLNSPVERVRPLRARLGVAGPC
jgi:hypothetical protein